MTPRLPSLDASGQCKVSCHVCGGRAWTVLQVTEVDAAGPTRPRSVPRIRSQAHNSQGPGICQPRKPKGRQGGGRSREAGRARAVVSTTGNTHWSVPPGGQLSGSPGAAAGSTGREPRDPAEVRAEAVVRAGRRGQQRGRRGEGIRQGLPS